MKTQSEFAFIAFHAFLGYIDEGVRAIAYEYSGPRIAIYGYLTRAPMPEDYEIIDYAITEIMASCPEILAQEIILTPSIGRFKPLKAHDVWIFRRNEEMN
ncbi:MAG: hypothetical protein LBS89_02490 [Zoogloeaceae bacterium]|nr:hypothetical protein [Zoogloeaceae bacterium]